MATTPTEARQAVAEGALLERPTTATRNPLNVDKQRIAAIAGELNTAKLKAEPLKSARELLGANAALDQREVDNAIQNVFGRKNVEGPDGKKILDNTAETTYIDVTLPATDPLKTTTEQSRGQATELRLNALNKLLKEDFSKIDAAVQKEARGALTDLLVAWPEGKTLLEQYPNTGTPPTERDKFLNDFLTRPELKAYVKPLLDKRLKEGTALALKDVSPALKQKLDIATAAETKAKAALTQAETERSALTDRITAIDKIKPDLQTNFNTVDAQKSALTTQLVTLQNAIDAESDPTLKAALVTQKAAKQHDMDTTVYPQWQGLKDRLDNFDATEKPALDAEKTDITTNKIPAAADKVADADKRHKQIDAKKAQASLDVQICNRDRSKQEFEYLQDVQKIMGEAARTYIEDEIDKYEAANVARETAEDTKLNDVRYSKIRAEFKTKWIKAKGRGLPFNRSIDAAPNEKAVNGDFTKLVAEGPEAVFMDQVKNALGPPPASDDEARAFMNEPKFKDEFQPILIADLVSHKFKIGGLTENQISFLIDNEWGEKAIDVALKRTEKTNAVKEKLEEHAKLAGLSTGEWIKKNKGSSFLIALLIAALTGLGVAATGGALLPAAAGGLLIAGGAEGVLAKNT